MHRTYSSRLQTFRSIEALTPEELGDDIIWIDLDSPDPEEERAVERCLGIDLPTREEMRDIEPSSRLYQEDGATFMTTALVWRAETDTPELANVGFVLSKNRLVTIRYAEPRAFRLFTAHAEREKTRLPNGTVILVTLLETIVDRTAEILEVAGGQVDSISREVFQERQDGRRRRAGGNLEAAMTQIALRQNLTAKARESLVSLGRMVSFLMVAPEVVNDREIREHLKSVSRDLSSLTDHASFLMSNINFLLEASLGLVNIEQNQIIKIFSVVAVIFLPPTLVASSYGMNFRFMPELDWVLGYPMALLMMVISALLPYLWFKRKGWL
jgi:magnesium transporter